AEDDAGVLDRVMHVDVQVALALDLDVDPPVPGEAVQHVVEEADPGGDLGAAGPVQIDADADLGLLGVADDVSRAGHGFPRMSFVRIRWRPRAPPRRPAAGGQSAR